MKIASARGGLACWAHGSNAATPACIATPVDPAFKSPFGRRRTWPCRPHCTGGRCCGLRKYLSPFAASPSFLQRATARRGHPVDFVRHTVEINGCQLSFARGGKG